MSAKLFSTYPNGIYLLNHSVGLPPVDARRNFSSRYFDTWEQSGEQVWPQWLSQIDVFRSALAKLLNADYQQFCPQTNLSSAFAKLLHSLPKKADRNTILLNAQDFPSMGFVAKLAQRSGFNLRYMPATLDATDLNHWDDALSAECCCVLITHVHSNTSTQVPVAAICNIARQKQVISIVDIAQSVGVVPIDLSSWAADFVLGSCVKWLCGGPGAGFLWANPSSIEQCQPLDVGWFSHANPFEFNIHDFRYAEGALRFWGGTPSVAPYLIAADSIHTIADIGVKQIRKYNCTLNQRILAAINPEAALCPLSDEHRGGTLVLDFGDDQLKVVDKLQQAQVQFDARPTGLRMSPHIYNTVTEIDQVIACIKEALINPVRQRL